MQQSWQLNQVFRTRAGHVREGQVKALKITKRAGLEESGQVVILKKDISILLQYMQYMRVEEAPVPEKVGI